MSHPDVAASIGLKVRAVRLAAGLSQQDLQDRSGVSRISIGKLENGILDVQVSTVVRIADALGVPVNELFDAVVGKVRRTRF